MMQGLALRTLISTAVFFLFILVWRGEGFGQQQLVQAFYSAIVFALMYAAIQTALAMFRGGKE